MPLTITVKAGNRGCSESQKESKAFDYPTFSEVRDGFVNGTEIAYFGTVQELFKFAYKHARVVEQATIRPTKDGLSPSPKRSSVLDQLVND